MKVVDVWLHSLLTSTLDEDELSAFFPDRIDTGPHWVGECVCPWVSLGFLKVEKISRCCLDRNHHYSAVQQVA